MSLILEILSNMCIVVVCWPGCDIINLEISLRFLIKPHFLHDQKFKTKSSISWERKELLSCNKIIFHHFYRDFIDVNKTKFFGGWKSYIVLSKQIGLSQIITETTYIVENLRSCIDLLFTLQPNKVMDSEAPNSPTELFLQSLI